MSKTVDVVECHRDEPLADESVIALDVASRLEGGVRPLAAPKKPLEKLAYGPLSFWFLNHRLEKDELAFQILEMKEKGFAGFFLHARSGLLTPYGSNAWYEALDFCIQEAKRLGMEAWLYDEDPYPSGAAGGKVILEHPELRASSLLPTVVSVEAGSCVDIDLPPGALVGAYLIQNGEVTRIDGNAGLVRTHWSQFFSTANYYRPYTAEGNPHWRAKATQPHYRIVLEKVAASALVVAFVRHYAFQDPWGDYPDLLNPKAVGYFIEYTHEVFAKRWNKEIGSVIPGIFTDEPRLRGDFPWSESVLPVFKEITGEDLPDILPHLAIEVDSRSSFYRWAYREALAQTLISSFSDQIQNVCDAGGLISTGHASPEEDPVGQVIGVPGLMRILAKLDIPGTDLIGADIGDSQHPLLHLSPKLASSVAHAERKPLVLCEAFAVVDWVQDLAFMAKALNWLYVLGVNRLTVHGQFYSIDGLRKREAAPSQFVQASYWEHFGALSRYVEGLGRYLTQGTHEAPVLLYYPEETFMALSCEERDVGNPRVTEAVHLREKFGAMVHELLTSGYDFDLADAEVIKKVSVKDGHVHVASERFGAVLVPGSYLRKDSLEALQAMERSGVPVFYAESSIEILSTKQAERFHPSRIWKSVAESLFDCVSPIFRAEGELIGHKRQTDEGGMIFLVNNGREAFDGEVCLNFSADYERWDGASDTWQTMEMPIHLQLTSGEGALIRSCQPSSAGPRFLRKEEWEVLMDFGSQWTARPLGDNCAILNEFRVIRYSSPKENVRVLNYIEFIGAPMVDLLSPTVTGLVEPEDRQRIFCTSFEWKGAISPLYMVCDSQLGPSGDKVSCENIEIFCNGKPLDQLVKKKRFDSYNREMRIDEFVKDGRNFIHMVQNIPTPAESDLPYDALRLFGQFHAEFPYGRSIPPELSSAPPCYKCGTPVHPAQMGHAHYGGLIRYETSLQLNAIPCRLGFRFEHVYESAELLVNGVHAGNLWKAPYFVEVAPSLFREGRNEIALICSTSPANYLQGLRRPAGTYGKIELCTARI